MDEKHFDEMRQNLHVLISLLDGHKGQFKITQLFNSLIDGQEKLWNRLTSAPIDIQTHDENGAVEL